MSRQSLTPGFGERLGTMQELMEEVLSIQRDGDRNEEAMVRLRDIIKDSGDLIQEAEDAQEILVIDANVLATGSHLLRAHVSTHDTNLTSFVPEEYTSGVLAFVEGASIGSSYNWDVLASETCSMFKKVPPLSYMLGTFVMDPPPPPEKQRQARQQKKISDSKKSVVETVEQTEHEGETSDEIYQHIVKSLIVQYRKNSKQPVNYLEFITDPDSYWRTVENIFHFSFLVRDEKVKMTLNDLQLPVVEPVLSRGRDGERAEKQRKDRQFNFRMSMHEWREIVDTFKIKKACIKPFRQG